MAKIDCRLMPGQDAEIIFENLKAYLADKGFYDIGIEKLAALPAYRIDLNEKIAKAASDAVRKVMGEDTATLPLILGSGAMAWLPLILDRPMGFAGCGGVYMAHRPNESITEEQYLKGIKLFATIYNDYALSSNLG